MKLTKSSLLLFSATWAFTVLLAGPALGAAGDLYHPSPLRLISFLEIS